MHQILFVKYYLLFLGKLQNVINRKKRSFDIRALLKHIGSCILPNVESKDCKHM
jgi:hypothetical protein